MMTITLDDTLTAHFQAIATQHHTSVEQVVNEILQEHFEDYLDILTAKQVLADIANGKEQVLSWKEVKDKLYDVES